MLLMACNKPDVEDDDDEMSAPWWPVSAAARLLRAIQTQQAAQPAWEQ
jgi:hypothetical protein